ncbi:hypothetical protein JCGZ_08145 [Jatropha curcas]|uniref:Uncharacterized protein n=1 Tax=Jatropha curcas TaxID=180498 RepID=A0A067KYC8_JATCU|nr:hypothetical protein JCGZ_08145 [Jatropha curcas]
MYGISADIKHRLCKINYQITIKGGDLIVHGFMHGRPITVYVSTLAEPQYTEVDVTSNLATEMLLLNSQVKELTGKRILIGSWVHAE